MLLSEHQHAHFSAFNQIFFSHSQINLPAIGVLADLVQEQTITSLTATNLLEGVITGNITSPREEVERKNLRLISDPVEIERICKEAIKQDPELFNKKMKAQIKISAFVKKVIALSNGRMPSESVAVIMEKLLKK